LCAAAAISREIETGQQQQQQQQQSELATTNGGKEKTGRNLRSQSIQGSSLY